MQHDFILLDGTSSMDRAGKWAEAVQAANTYVKKIANDGVDTGVTLAVFNSARFDILRDRIIPKTWQPLGLSEFHPSGMTPLNDAVGKIVARANAGNYDRVAVIIITDGEENCSQELTTKQVADLLDECRKKEWVVTMLGAQFDNWHQAQAYGNAPQFTSSVAPGKMSTATAILGTARDAYGMTGQSTSMAFSDADKADFIVPGVPDRDEAKKQEKTK